MRDHTICFNSEVRKIISELSLQSSHLRTLNLIHLSCCFDALRPRKQLWSCGDGQLTQSHFSWAGFPTIPFHLDLFSAALVELAKSIPVHSYILSSHLFFCLPFFLFAFTVPCRIVFAKPEDLETWPNHLSFRFLTRVRSSSYSPMAAWVFLRTSSLVTWSLYEMFNSLREHLISKACVLFSNSAVKVHDSQAYRNMEITKERISFTFDPRDMLLSLQMGFSFVRAAVECAILERTSDLEPSSETMSCFLPNRDSKAGE